MVAAFHITPTAGEIDLDRVRAWLDARPDVFEDPHGTGVYVLCGMPPRADLAYRARREDGSRFPLAVLIALGPDRIRIDQELAGTAQLQSSLGFVRWLVDTFDVAIAIPGVEAAAPIRDVASLYPDGIRAAPVPWAGSLIGIGFFRDLDDGHNTTTVWLEDACRDHEPPDEEDIAQYLESGHLYRRSDVTGWDPLDMSEHDPAVPPPHLYTDGVYMWRGDLPYFVRTYHVRLPRHFAIHARKRGWRVGPVDVSTLPPIDVDGGDDDTGDHCTLCIDEAQVVFGRSLRSGTGDQVREGYLVTAPDRPVLVTMTVRHEESYDELREQLALEAPGIAPMRWLGPMPDHSIGFEDVLIEDLPDGRPAAELAPMPEAAVIRVGAGAARALEAAHRRGLVVLGVSPELLYIDDELRFAGLVPRGRAFVATAPQRLSGESSYPVPYAAREIVVGGAPGAANDVFALCATLHVLVTGENPFGPTDSVVALFKRVMHDDRAPYPGSGNLGAVLARGMAADPAARLTAAELAVALEELA